MDGNMMIKKMSQKDKDGAETRYRLVRCKRMFKNADDLKKRVKISSKLHWVCSECGFPIEYMNNEVGVYFYSDGYRECKNPECRWWR